MRVDEDQPWQPFYLVQPLWNFINALFFEYGIAAYDLELRGAWPRTSTKDPEFKAPAKKVIEKIRKQATKDYLVHPLLSRPARSCPPWPPTSPPTSCATSGRTRSSCAATSPRASRRSRSTSIEGETRGEWYVRQMLGSANISGSKLMHIMTGNLSHQIEHHLFPDLPSNRYAEIAPKVRGALREVRPELPLAPAAAAGLLRVAQGGPALAAQRLDGDTTTKRNLPSQLGKLYKMVTGTPRERRLIQASLTRDARARRAAAA